MAPSMEKELARADKQVLVEVVKMAQKRGLKGVDGEWKEFLNRRDRKFGDTQSDPAKKSVYVLVEFLKTFREAEDINVFLNIFRRHRNLKGIQRLMTDVPENESPEQKLVRLTTGHPLYLKRYLFPSLDKGWTVVSLGKPSKSIKSNIMVAVDCEMVLCEDGTEALVQVCAVDRNMETKLNMFIKPDTAVKDYRTEITGLSAKDFEGVTCSLADVQNRMKKLLLRGTILVGHTLCNDLQALKIDHPRVIDTAFIFKYANGDLKTPSLNNLCKAVLGAEIRKEGDPHNCLEDARAAMRLVLSKMEHGFDYPIEVACKNVTEVDLSKLLLHKIPVDVPDAELLKIFPAKLDASLQTDLKPRGKTYYSTFVVFKNSRKADKAFRKLNGLDYQDTSGRLQKLVCLKLESGKAVNFYVRKMAPESDLNNCDALKKRTAEDAKKDSKKQKKCIHESDQTEEMES